MKIFIFCTIFLKTVFGACLNDSDLFSLGYIPKTAETIQKSTKICNVPSAFEQLCVDQENLKIKIKNDSLNLRWFMFQTYSLDEIFDRYVEAIYKSAINLTDASNLIRGIRRIYYSSVNNFESCYSELAYLQQGVNCILASSNATDFSFINDTSVMLKFDIDKFGENILSVCLDTFDAICMAATGISLTLEFSGSFSNVSTSFGSKYSTVCNQLYSQRNCVNCTERNELFVTSFLKPFFYDMFLSNADQKIIKNYFDNTLINSTSLFDSRELRINPTIVNFFHDSNGTDYAQIGRLSGFDSTLSSLSFHSSTFILFLIISLTHRS